MTQELAVALTRAQVERSPDIDTKRPVSRQHEAEYPGTTDIRITGAEQGCGAWARFRAA